MLTTADLLRAARDAQGLPSNYRLARFLDVPEKTVQRWNTGKNIPDDQHALRLAELSGIDAGIVLASLAAQRSTDAQARTLWEGIAQRLQSAGLGSLAAVIVSAGLFGGSGDAQAAPSALSSLHSNSLYIMSTVRRFLLALMMGRRISPAF